MIFKRDILLQNIAIDLLWKVKHLSFPNFPTLILLNYLNDSGILFDLRGRHCQ